MFNAFEDRVLQFNGLKTIVFVKWKVLAISY